MTFARGDPPQLLDSVQCTPIFKTVSLNIAWWLNECSPISQGVLLKVSLDFVEIASIHNGFPLGFRWILLKLPLCLPLTCPLLFTYLNVILRRGPLIVYLNIADFRLFCKECPSECFGNLLNLHLYYRGPIISLHPIRITYILQGNPLRFSWEIVEFAFIWKGGTFRISSIFADFACILQGGPLRISLDLCISPPIEGTSNTHRKARAASLHILAAI